MKSWYRTIREDELKDGSVRKVYHLVFETDDKSIVEKIEQFFYDVMDAKTEPTISKMEQVDKDINVRSKDEPQTNADQHVQHVESVEQTEREGE